METIYSAVQEFQLGLITVIITCSLLFAAGYWLGIAKSKKLFIRKLNKMEKEILDLNAELLYNGKEGNSLVQTGSKS
jgi:energy-converting hydrogenase Eha subunit H